MSSSGAEVSIDKIKVMYYNQEAKMKKVVAAIIGLLTVIIILWADGGFYGNVKYKGENVL